MRLNKKDVAALRTLSLECMRGSEILECELTHGVLSRSSLYVVLDSLEERGLVKSIAEASDLAGIPPRRSYALTHAGWQAVSDMP